MVTLRKNTVAELMRLSPADKREVATWLRQEAREQLEKLQEPGEKGSTVAEATEVLEALRGLDQSARGMIINQILQEEAGKDGR